MPRTPAETRPVARTSVTSKQIDIPRAVPMTTCAFSGTTRAASSASPSSISTAMMPVCRMLEYASRLVFLIVPSRVHVSMNAPSVNSFTDTIAATFSPGSMPTKFTMARPREVRDAGGIS